MTLELIADKMRRLLRENVDASRPTGEVVPIDQELVYPPSRPPFDGRRRDREGALAYPEKGRGAGGRLP